MKVHFELMKCINDQLTRAKHASRSAAEASFFIMVCHRNLPGIKFLASPRSLLDVIE